MRKNLFVICILLVSFVLNNKAKAQTVYLSNGLQVQWVDKDFVASTAFEVGYEFNEHWAVGALAALSAQVQNTLIAGMGAGGYIRYTPVHNDVIYLDVKASARGQYYTTDAKNFLIGLYPSLRFRFAPRWEAFTDIGFFGARYTDAFGWYPLLGFNPQNAVVGITYRFR